MNSNAPDTTPAAAPQDASVFVVDDERALGALIGEILELEGFRPTVFSDPGSALEALSSSNHPPAVVVTDFAMGGFNGIELIRRSREHHPNLRTVLVSGSMTSEALDRETTQPDCFVAKPFAPRTLVDAVRSAASARR